jgi:hypothetical protein
LAFLDGSEAYDRLAGLAESMFTVTSVSAKLGSRVGSDKPPLSRMLNAKASGVPPLSTFVVRSNRNDKLAPGVNDSTNALNGLLAVRLTVLVRSPLAPPKVQGAAGQLEPALPPAPKAKSLSMAVLLFG